MFERTSERMEEKLEIKIKDDTLRYLEEGIRKNLSEMMDEAREKRIQELGEDFAKDYMRPLSEKLLFRKRISKTEERELFEIFRELEKERDVRLEHPLFGRLATDYYSIGYVLLFAASILAIYEDRKTVVAEDLDKACEKIFKKSFFLC